MRKGKKPCESELAQLARSLGHLNRLAGCSTEEALREAIGGHSYNRLSQDGEYPFGQIKTHCANRMEDSINFQRGEIKWKLGLFGIEKPKDLPDKGTRGLAAYCLGVTA